MDNINIRLARDSDVKAILKLVLELIDVMKNKDMFDISSVPDNLKMIFNNNNAHFLVAEEGESIIGFAHFTTRLTILHPGPSAIVEEIAVSADKRGQGVGEKLLSAVVENCGKIGCSEVEVSTEKGNEKASAFYRKMGFDEDAVLFEKHLN